MSSWHLFGADRSSGFSGGFAPFLPFGCSLNFSSSWLWLTQYQVHKIGNWGPRNLICDRFGDHLFHCLLFVGLGNTWPYWSLDALLWWKVVFAGSQLLFTPATHPHPDCSKCTMKTLSWNIKFGESKNDLFWLFTLVAIIMLTRFSVEFFHAN